MLSPYPGKHVTRSLKHEAVRQVVWSFLLRNVGTITKACLNSRNPSQVEVFQNDTDASSTNGEQIKGKEVTDKSTERPRSHTVAF